MREITVDDLSDIARGAADLRTGGGGRFAHGAPCWRSPEGLTRTGPAYVGHDHEYVPV